MVLTRNNPRELEDTLASIRSQRVAASLHVVVVDGSETPVPPKALTPFEIVRDHPARGIYPAMNLSLARSRGQWVQFLNRGDSWGQRAPHRRPQLGFPVHDTGHLHDDLSLRALCNPTQAPWPRPPPLR